MSKGYFIMERNELEEYGGSEPMTREEADKAISDYASFGSDLVVIYGEVVPLVLGAEPPTKETE